MGAFDRRTFLKVAGGIGATSLTALAGCSGGGETDGTTTDGDDGSGDDVTNVGMVYATGGLGDGSFNDQAQSGIMDAAEDFNVEYNESQPENTSDFSSHQEQFAQSTDPNYDLVASIGYLQADSLADTAANYPDQQFMIVDETVDADNVASYVFREHEGSYLVGQLAGLLTTREFSAGGGETKPDEKVVGFVGGVEGGLIGKFEAGFAAGVKSIDSEIEVKSGYAGSFTDPSTGTEIADDMYSGGADIVYHAAGNTGTGVFESAQSNGRFAIGVDRDQSITKDGYADVILASMVKRVDTAVYTAVESVVNDAFESGTNTLGLDDDGVATVYGDQIGSEIPQEIKDQVSSSRDEIMAGDIEVPTDPENV
ncbi:ABC transporter substrate-binding protein [Halodesulfurarchaeum formicicum]|uniref:ABC transporter substrate-binding protein n=1 Tax=Halodesulfurarchaeum formicicum TaxID=1873524 RepID=A0A1D8S3R7_9EURY|nr:BMP family protein [Halodesulfurarchaeum formicicum]AOW79984.1 ABC transporter substrate-binding protein [Halodesulfurarchaeum formicicum]APE95278.1 ABC transporter substrate-binding protein [Halodesulfurarchaeum formicicum]